MWNLKRYTGAIAGIIFAAAGTTVFHIFKNGKRIADMLV